MVRSSITNQSADDLGLEMGKEAYAVVADGPVCRIEIFEPWRQALDSVDQFEQLECSTGSISRGATS